MRKCNWFEKSGNSRIHCVKWLPDDEPLGIIQIAHGVTEYVERYEQFAELMTGRGFVVCGNDHRGHGESCNVPGTPMYLGEKGAWFDVAEDLYNLSCKMKEEYPQIPYVLLGFSMGSFLARTAIIKHPDMANAVILVGTGQQRKVAIKLAKYIAKKEAEEHGYDQVTEKIDDLTFGTYNKKFVPVKTKFDWLSSDEDAVEMYLNDPKRGDSMTVGLFSEMLDGMEFTANKENIRKMKKYVPVLFISGSKDPVGENGRGVKRAAATFHRAGVKMVDVILYRNCRHDIFHDVCRDEVFYDILVWLYHAIGC